MWESSSDPGVVNRRWVPNVGPRVLNLPSRRERKEVTPKGIRERQEEAKLSNWDSHRNESIRRNPLTVRKGLWRDSSTTIVRRLLRHLYFIVSEI